MELIIIGSRQTLNAQCDDVEIRIDDFIKRVDHTKSLSLTIDSQLSSSKHVQEILTTFNVCDPLYQWKSFNSTSSFAYSRSHERERADA